MKAMKVNINSWHFWLATFLTTKHSVLNERNNLCAYTRGVMWGALRLFLVLSVGCLFLTPVVIYTTHFFADWWNNEAIKFSVIACGVYLTIAAIIAGIIFGGTWWDKRKEAKRDAIRAAQIAGTWTPPPVPEPSMLTKMYRGWKEKHCSKVEFGSIE